MGCNFSGGGQRWLINVIRRFFRKKRVTDRQVSGELTGVACLALNGSGQRSAGRGGPTGGLGTHEVFQGAARRRAVLFVRNCHMAA